MMSGEIHRRPLVTVDGSQIAWLRYSGVSLREIACRLGASLGTVAAWFMNTPGRFRRRRQPSLAELPASLT